MAAMNRRNFLGALASGTALYGLSSPVHSKEKPVPNIVLVFVDDMGWSDLSCFGNRDASTPNIDRLAAEGISFENFYVNAPICSPSRVAISTGQYPLRWGITSFLNNRKANRERGVADWLDPAAPMLAHDLRAAGYATGHFGKWHMGGQRDVNDAPEITEYGFDTSLTNFEGMGPKLLPLTLEPGEQEPGRIWQDAERLGGPFTWMQRSSITGGFVSAALEFMQKAEAAQKPFYVNLWPDDVHSPFFPPVEHWDKDKRSRYLAVLEAMDRQLGFLFDYVRDNERLQDNTLVLFCSDNGPEPGAGRSQNLKGSKAMLFEGGIRSPLIVWGPGIVDRAAAGTRNSTSLLAAIDLVPSITALTGAYPAPGTIRDGESVLDILLGKSQQSRQGPLFFNRPPDRKDFSGFKSLPDLAIREGDWKLLCDYDGSRPLLHNIADDPSESVNLAEAHPDLVEKLISKVTRWYKATCKDDPESKQ